MGRLTLTAIENLGERIEPVSDSAAYKKKTGVEPKVAAVRTDNR
jgi:hypothetical protein